MNDLSANAQLCRSFLREHVCRVLALAPPKENEVEIRTSSWGQERRKWPLKYKVYNSAAAAEWKKEIHAYFGRESNEIFF